MFVEENQKEIDKKERLTAVKLKENCSTDAETSGIIGARSLTVNEWVERAPLSIYWNGLRTFGFFRTVNPNFTFADFLALLNNIERNRIESKKSDSSSKDEKDDDDAGNYAKKCPLIKLSTYTKNWRTKIDIELTNAEALFLKDKIIKCVPDSLLAFILKNNIDISDCTDFETLTYKLSKKVNADLRNKMEMANKANDFYYVAYLRYSYLLCKGENQNIVDEWNYIQKELKKICNEFDIETLFSTMKIMNPKLKVFLVNLKKAFLEDNLEKADELIVRREFNLKHNRAKLRMNNNQKQEVLLPGKWDFRLEAASRIIKDIFNGEKND